MTTWFVPISCSSNPTIFAPPGKVMVPPIPMCKTPTFAGKHATHVSIPVIPENVTPVVEYLPRVTPLPASVRMVMVIVPLKATGKVAIWEPFVLSVTLPSALKVVPFTTDDGLFKVIVVGCGCTVIGDGVLVALTKFVLLLSVATILFGLEAIEPEP